MNEEIIGLIIKWGPLALVGITFIVCFINGLIKGTYKVLRRVVYCLLYVILTWIFIDDITNLILNINIPINGIGRIKDFLANLIEGNEGISKFLGYSPELKKLIVDSPEIIASPVLFIVLVVVVLPISFPIYWVYLLIWHIFAKYVFKREKYEKNQKGEILRNEKGKKIKVQRKKRRLLGGLIYGIQGIVLICVSLLPVNFVNRIYNKAKSKASLEENETLCSSLQIEGLDDKLCKYMDMYNETIFGKLGGEISLDKVVMDHLTTVEVDNEKINLETELTSASESFVLLGESGLLSLLTKGEINLAEVDLSEIDFDKLNEAIDSLFNSYIVSRLSEAGVNYALNEVLKGNLVSLLKDDDIVSKLAYEDSKQIKEEIKNVINVIKYMAEKNMDDLMLDNTNNVLNIVNGVKDDELEVLLNKILSLRIINNSMPSILKAYGEKYGVNAPENMTSELNGEVTTTFVNAVKLVKTMQLNSLEDLTTGNIVDNLVNSLFKDGALKDTTKDSLATLLNDINTSNMFSGVLSSQINKLLEGKDYKVDARVVKYVNDKEGWVKELSVLDSAYSIYEEHKETEKIDYSKVSDLLNSVSGTKVLISILPFAYDELLPKLGIEIDSDGLPVIEFDKDNEEATKIEFYNIWEKELLMLKNISDSIDVLDLKSFEDISENMLSDDDNVQALSNIMGAVYSSSFLKDPFVNFMVDKMNSFVSEYGISFTKEELSSIDSKDKWYNEFSNIGKVLSVDFSDENNITGENLSKVFTSVGNMKLIGVKKIEILKYAINESEFLTEEEYRNIEWPQNNEESVNEFWNNETSVLVNVVDKKDTIKELSNVDVENMDTVEIGGLINEVMKSKILKPIVVDKVSKLLYENDVRDDRDQGEDTTNLKNTIGSIEHWEVELDSIKSLVNSIDTFIDTRYIEINSLDRYVKDGETYVQNDAGDYLKDGETYHLIKEEDRFNKEIDKYVQNDEGSYLKISTTVVESIFTTIESSELLKNSRANLLLKAVKTVDITEIPSGVDAALLRGNSGEYDLYKKERDIIIRISNNKNLTDGLAFMDLGSININEVGAFLDDITSSIIFKDYVVVQIVDVFDKNGVEDDRDYALGGTTKLKESVSNIKNWNKELEIIQSMLTMDGDTFNEQYYEILNANRYSRSEEDGQFIYTRNDNGEYLKVGINYYHILDVNRYNRSFVNESYVYTQNNVGNYLKVPTSIERMFDNIESSSLLVNMRANLLIKAIGTINLKDIKVPGDVTVSTLMDNGYTQYENEINVFITFAENMSAVNGLNDITALNNDSKNSIGEVLDAMKLSEILKDKYVSTIDTALNSIRNNDYLEEYGVSFKTKAETNNYKNVKWADYSEDQKQIKGEITNLLEISNNIKSVYEFNGDSIKTSEGRNNVASVVGATLDAIDSTYLLKAPASGSNSQNIANAVISKISDGRISNIDKGSKSWSQVFDETLAILNNIS